MSKPLLNELFQKPNAEFTKHLNDPENARILFSGKFGIGKTTFINQFFEDNPEYVKIHLYPVNYSIASNEDIIDLIKYDILMELINTGIEFEEEEIPLKDKLYGFSQNNALEILRTIITCVPKTGKDIASSIKGFEDLYTSFQKYCDQISSDQGKDTLEFIEKIQNGKGSIYEQTVISRLISAKVEQLKNAGSTSKRQVVLIIDDLDRIDPEHIFRLFNVFAAHFDSSNSDNSSNKFEFDKVVFVCDVDNIRSIFKHRYGVDTDFGGYIDKFYSREVFVFDNILNANKTVNEIISRMLFRAVRDKVSSHTIIDQIEELLTIFLETALHLRLVTLRSLCKFLDKQVITPFDKVIHYEMQDTQEMHFSFLIACRIIRSIIGNDLESLRILQNNQHYTNVPKKISYFADVIKLAFTPLFIYQHKISPNPHTVNSIKIYNRQVTREAQTSKINISDLQDPQTGDVDINVLLIFLEGIQFIIELDKSNGKLVYNSSKDLVLAL